MTKINNVLVQNSYNLMNYLLKTVPRFIDKIQLNTTENRLVLFTSNSNLLNLITFLKNDQLLQFKTLISITAVDYPQNKDRFEINYFLLSYKLNTRLIIKLSTSDTKPVHSITSIYKGANWYEREVWDLFGVFFSNHPDLRRILTDYGFEGFPFRKDFPQTGFVEVRYDDQKKYVLYEPLELAQEFRSFDFISPWSNLK